MYTLDLSHFFKTKSEAIDFSTRLGTVIDALFTTDFSLETTLSDQFGIQKKERFIKLLRENKVNTTSIHEIKTFLTSLQETITKLPILDITIAFEPKEKQLQAISDWFVLTNNQQVLLNITIDPSIIAGAKINYNGKFLDVSIKPVFDEIATQAIAQPVSQTQASAP